jgi:putative membrane protein
VAGHRAAVERREVGNRRTDDLSKENSMANALNFLTNTEQEQVEQAIVAAEKKTSAEIVCAVATESGRYDRTEAIVGLLTAVAALVLTNVLAFYIAHWAPEPGDWSEYTGLALGWQIVAVVVGFLLGSVIASYVHPLRRLLVQRQELEAETLRAAWYIFAQQCISSTRHAGGLLIYVSLFERRAVVLGDKGIVSHLGQEFLDQLRDVAVANLRKRDRLKTFLESVELAAEKLSAPLPYTESDANELPNHLVIIHPRP